PVAAPPPAVRLEGRAGVGEDARRARSGGEGRLARRGRRGVGEVAGAETRAGRRRRRGGRRRCPEGEEEERGGSCSESREPHHEESKNNIWNPAGIRAGPSGNDVCEQTYVIFNPRAATSWVKKITAFEKWGK
ncbi:hypothetical protein THAOC_26339, partial [Thalassiosira oceanica]